MFTLNDKITKNTEQKKDNKTNLAKGEKEKYTSYPVPFDVPDFHSLFPPGSFLPAFP